MEDDCEVKRQRKKRKYGIRKDPFKMDDYEFYKSYVFDKITTKFIIQMIEDEMDFANHRGLPISTSLQVLITLMFLGRHLSQNDIARCHGVSQTSISRSVKIISRRLASHLHDFIQFPNDDDGFYALRTEFYEVAKFPCVIGAIGCIHLRIKSFIKDIEAKERMIKTYHPYIMQIVCDADCKILDFATRTESSKNDSRLWETCGLKTTLESTQTFHEGVLLGDGAYPASNIMLTPVKYPSTEKDRIYNQSHSATRQKVLTLNRQLKSKIQLSLEKIRVDFETAKDIIAAIVVLHNIAKERNIPFLDAAPVDQAPEAPPTSSMHINESPAALNFRTAFINQYF